MWHPPILLRPGPAYTLPSRFAGSKIPCPRTVPIRPVCILVDLREPQPHLSQFVDPALQAARCTSFPNQGHRGTIRLSQDYTLLLLWVCHRRRAQWICTTPEYHLRTRVCHRADPLPKQRFSKDAKDRLRPLPKASPLLVREEHSVRGH